MTKRRSTAAAFRDEHELVLHKLIPHACAYGAALNDGDPVACEEELDAMAALLMGEFGRAVRPVPVATPVALPDNVTPLARP